MAALIDVILPVFLVICLGFVAAKRALLSEAAIDGLMSFSQNLAIPLLLFRAISTLDLNQGFDPGLLASYYTGSLISFTLGLFGARHIFKRNWADSVAIGFTALFANSVLLGLAIMERAYGSDALAPNYAIIAIHAPFCYLLGITTMEIVRNSGQGPLTTAHAVGKAMFRNNLMIGIGLGFVANLSGVSFPRAFNDGIDLITRAALPTALFALGSVLTRYRPGGSIKEVIWICTISLMVHPSITYVMSTQVFDLTDAQIRGAVLTASMAPGINAFIFATMYDAAKREAATSVLVGTVISVLSISFWLSVLGVN